MEELLTLGRHYVQSGTFLVRLVFKTIVVVGARQNPGTRRLLVEESVLRRSTPCAVHDDIVPRP